MKWMLGRAGKVLSLSVLLALLAGCQSTPPEDATTTLVTWDLMEAPQADATHVPLLLAAESSCGSEGALPQVADVEVEETASAVTITTHVETAIEDAGVCAGTGIGIKVSARLADPLGDRRLVDGACLDADLQGHALCEEGKSFRTTAESRVCREVQDYVKAGKATIELAQSSYPRQLRAQRLWRGSLRRMAGLMSGRPHDAALALSAARTTVSDQSWTPAQEAALSFLNQHLNRRCGLHLETGERS